MRIIATINRPHSLNADRGSYIILTTAHRAGTHGVPTFSGKKLRQRGHNVTKKTEAERPYVTKVR